MEIYERIYDCDTDKDGNKKPNKLLGNFELLEGSMNDYSYEVYVKDEAGVVYKLTGREISYDNGGTKHFISKLEDSPDVQAFIKFSPSSPQKEVK